MQSFTHTVLPEVRQRMTTVASVLLVTALLGQAPAGALPTDGPTPIVVTNPGGDNPDGEEPEKAYDGDLDTKWLDRNFEGGEGGNPSILQIEFCVPVSFDGYRWETAKDSDEEEREPVEWEVQTSSDGENWTPVDTRDVSGPSAFGPSFTVGPFSLETSVTTARVRWVITEARDDDADMIQAAEFVLLNGGVALANLSDPFPCDTPEPTAVRSTIAVACTPSPLAVGALVTCTVSGGDPGIDVLWRAAYNPVFAGAGLTLDGAGSGTFAFTVPAAALGQVVSVELVEWLAPVSLGVAGGPVPGSVPAGEGPVPVWPMVFAALAGVVLMRRGMLVKG